MRKVKLFVHETYQGKRKSEDVFAAVFLSNAAALTPNTHSGIIKDTERSQDSLCSEKGAALEQAGMAYYHTINTANKMNNQINSVSPKYWGAFKELALGTLNYGWNQMSNEILYWTGN